MGGLVRPIITFIQLEVSSIKYHVQYEENNNSVLPIIVRSRG